MPAAIAIPAIIGAAGVVGNVVTGVKGANAATSAGQLQHDAAIKAGQQVVDTTQAVNPSITAAADNAGRDVRTAAADSAAGYWTSTDRANNLLDPYRAAGDEATQTLREQMLPGGAMGHDFNTEDFQKLDPGWQARLQEATRELGRSQAARGNSISGAALKDITKFSQDYAGNEVGAAFGRFETQKNDRFNNLFRTAGLGYDAAGKEGTNFTNAGRYAGDLNYRGAEFSGDSTMRAADLVAGNTINASRAEGEYLTQGANAQAAGKIGSANATGNMVGGIASSVGNALTLSQLMKNPSLDNGYYSSSRGYVRTR